MKTPDISIVVPCRNMDRFLEETLVSALQQTVREIELIVVNDGSTDGSEAIVAALAAQDDRVRLIDGPARGVSAARNAGASVAQADVLLFLDGDDLLVPDSVERMLVGLREAPEAIGALAGVRRIDVAGGPLPGADNRALAPQTHPAQIRAILRKNIVVNPGNFAIRRVAFDLAGGFDPDLANGEDWALWCRICTLGRFAVVSGPPVLAYRQVPGGANSRPRRPFERVPSIEKVAQDPDIRRAVGRELGWLLRARRVDYFWSGVRNDLLYGARSRALLAGLVGLVAYPDGLLRPRLVRRFILSLSAQR